MFIGGTRTSLYNEDELLPFYFNVALFHFNASFVSSFMRKKKKQRFINRARFKYLLLVSCERKNHAHYVTHYTILLSFIFASGKRRKMNPG
jgi:hypothetical protein